MTLALAIPTIILALGVADDLRSRKVHNELVLACFGLAAAFCLYDGGAAGLLTGLMGLGAAAMLTLPLVLFGVLGAGDMKIFMAFGMAVTWDAVIGTGFGSLIWGAVFGIFRAMLSGELKLLMQNMIHVAMKKPAVELHRIPYTVALFMGWATYVAGRIS
jgi:Flp pilus assembly protein protease CpaA